MSQQLESYQDEIYLTGLTGAVPGLPAGLHRLEEAARAVMTPRAFDYVAGSAGSGETAAENLLAFRRWRIVPRMLTDVSTPSYAARLLGTDLTVPFLLAPVGVLGIAHPEGELAVARAAASAGGPMILSTASSTPMEAVAAANEGGAGISCTGLRTGRSRPACSAGPRRPATVSSSSRWPPAPSAGGRATWTTATCRSCRAPASRTTCPTPRSRRASRRPSRMTCRRPSCATPRCSATCHSPGTTSRSCGTTGTGRSC